MQQLCRLVARTLAVWLLVFASSNLAHAQQVGYAYGNLPDLGAPLLSGFYQGAGGITGDVPDTAHSWTHLLNIRHSNPSNNHQLQIAASYATNDRLFFRKIAMNSAVTQNPSWNEVATRGANTFSGTQTINGNLSLGGRLYIEGSEFTLGTNDGRDRGVKTSQRAL